ncbi:hypothetical protein GCM10017643_14890 [Ancylobacter dichloromethanicus]|uniref:Uncharacterized protein n=1 Tax=Ancylobacter dichloromethanicus TaxID=518825 RepID=A0A9W6J8S7_9HYPH|nr:hypothetical protein GCM10017643_14890 [Ancylobacter dichloromethanicus]
MNGNRLDCRLPILLATYNLRQRDARFWCFDQGAGVAEWDDEVGALSQAETEPNPNPVGMLKTWETPAISVVPASSAQAGGGGNTEGTGTS